jgi:cysteine desulfurase
MINKKAVFWRLFLLYIKFIFIHIELRINNMLRRVIMAGENGSYIYLDHNATTPLDRAVIEAMIPYIKDDFGNPSSGYSLGVRAKEGVEQARKEVSSLLGCKDTEIIFTSGGTEANNMALKGLIDFRSPKNFHIISTAVEHPAVLNPLLYLMELGTSVSIIPVDNMGRADPDDIRKAITPETILISVMLANNETGTIQPIKEIARIAKESNIPFHTDAAQAVGKVHVNVDDLGVDFLSVAGHKLYGPKGIGALYIRDGIMINPLMHGAGQEGGKRAGTENVILSVGLGAACRASEAYLNDNSHDISHLRDRLQDLLFDGIDGLVLNGHPKERLPNTLNVSVPNMEGAKILEGLPTLFASTGAACHDRTVTLSHVLSAMNVSPEIGMGALRLTLGRSNTEEQIDEAAKVIIDRVSEMRGTV